MAESNESAAPPICTTFAFERQRLIRQLSEESLKPDHLSASVKTFRMRFTRDVLPALLQQPH